MLGQSKSKVYYTMRLIFIYVWEVSADLERSMK